MQIDHAASSRSIVNVYLLNFKKAVKLCWMWKGPLLTASTIHLHTHADRGEKKTTTTQAVSKLCMVGPGMSIVLVHDAAAVSTRWLQHSKEEQLFNFPNDQPSTCDLDFPGKKVHCVRSPWLKVKSITNPVVQRIVCVCVQHKYIISQYSEKYGPYHKA